MCSNPVTIRIKNDGSFNPDRLMWLPALKSDSVYKNILPTLRKDVTVPCGKCIECLKVRQNDLASRCAREASLRGSMFFVTLTYEDKYLPFAVRLHEIDSSTGEVLNSSPLDFLHSEHLPECRSLFRQASKSSKPFHFWKAAEDLNAFYGEDRFFYEVTPSLRRQDVRLWIKRCRVQYKRLQGCSLPEFSYALVGEYGPNTARPHYHLAFFGLNREQVSFFVSSWNYGFTNVKQVNAINEDGTNGFLFASRYIGKYMTKGRFECESVKDCSSEKPRLCNSLGLGYDRDSDGKPFLSASLLAYYRGFDVVGKYDILTCRKETGDYLSKDELLKLRSVLTKRNSMTICGQSFKLPNVFLKKIWYAKDFEGKIFSSPVRSLLSSFVSPNVFGDYLKKRGKDTSFLSHGEVSRLCNEFVSELQTCHQLKDSHYAQDVQSWYNKSIH